MKPRLHIQLIPEEHFPNSSQQLHTLSLPWNSADFKDALI